MQTDTKEILLKVGRYLLILLGGTLLAVATDLLPAQLLNRISVTLWAKITVILSALCLYLAVWFVYLSTELKKKPNFKPYFHNAEKGYWQHAKTGERICAACKLDGILSPLHKHVDGWRCPRHRNTVGYEATDTVSSPGVNYQMP